MFDFMCNRLFFAVSFVPPSQSPMARGTRKTKIIDRTKSRTSKRATFVPRKLRSGHIVLKTVVHQPLRASSESSQPSPRKRARNSEAPPTPKVQSNWVDDGLPEVEEVVAKKVYRGKGKVCTDAFKAISLMPVFRPRMIIFVRGNPFAMRF